jgi:hypothetical protein
MHKVDDKGSMVTEYRFRVYETDYIWRHGRCFCSSHCGSDQLIKVDGEEQETYGTFDNAELCDVMTALLEEQNRLEKLLAEAKVPTRQELTPEQVDYLYGRVKKYIDKGQEDMAKLTLKDRVEAHINREV